LFHDLRKPISIRTRPDAARAVAYGISENFDNLPENVRNELLLKVADSKEAAGVVAEAVSSNFDKLPGNVRNLLFKLADYYDEIPENVRNQLLYELTNNSKALPNDTQ
jgi:hypothetical protein